MHTAFKGPLIDTLYDPYDSCIIPVKNQTDLQCRYGAVKPLKRILYRAYDELSEIEPIYNPVSRIRRVVFRRLVSRGVRGH